jgi:biopolymer transport protein TolQ
VTFSLILAQAPAGELATAWEMIWHGSPSTKIVIVVLAFFSLLSWTMILWKYFLFRKLWRQASGFLEHLESSKRLEEAYRSVLSLPESPFTRIFRKGVNFFSELRPGALREGAVVVGLSPAQLEVLRLVLEKEEGEERDEIAYGLEWLAIVATVSPLLGLLGTVLGVMNSFIGVSAAGSANISAVAPGIAEALVTTVAGLVVAIPAAIGFNYFSGRMQLFISELEGLSSEFIGSLAREGKV